MSICVVTVCDKEPTIDYLLRGWKALNESLSRHKVQPIVLGFGQKWGGLGSKPKLLKQAIESGLVNTDRLIFVDSHDVIFTHSPEHVEEVFDSTYEMLYDIVFNGERWIFPDPALGEHHPNTEFPYRYLNSGAAIGNTQDFLTMLEQMEVDSWPDDFQRPDGSWSHLNDQLEVQKKYLFGQVMPHEPKIRVDDRCYMFQTLVGESLENFDISHPGVVRNLLTGTAPSIIHGNGPAKNEPVWNAILSQLNL